jgi:hypothetical protein
VRRLSGTLAVALLLVAACGKKAPPLPPLRPVPAAVGGLTARRLGDTVYLQFTVPAQNQDGTRPADLAAVELYALTVPPPPPGVAPLTASDLVRRGVLVAAVAVRPPAADAGEPAGSRAPATAPDERPGPGDRVTVVDPLTAEALTPREPAAWGRERTPTRAPEPRPAAPAPLWWPPRASWPQRVYVAVGISGRGRRGVPSALVSVPLGPIPAAPPAAAACYSETAVTVEWVAAPTARRLVQGPAVGAPLAARPLVSGLPPTRYNVYETAAPGAAAPLGPRGAPPRPLNATPLDTPPFSDPRIEFGTTRCYVVRAVDTLEGIDVEGPPSPPACVTLTDIFPPPPPQRLSAVAGEAAIYLLWEPSRASDVAGYLVLRGEAPDEKLRALTPAPVGETTYRDTAVRPGQRYVYAVVAVDRAGNVSPPSNRVEETAR